MTTTVHQIEFVFIESDPFPWDMIDPEYADLPPQYLNALQMMAARRDNVACARCDGLTGYVVVYNPVTDGDKIEWQSVGLARESDGPVFVLCGDCTPLVPDRAPIIAALIGPTDPS